MQANESVVDVDKYYLRKVDHNAHQLIAGMQNQDEVWRRRWRSEQDNESVPCMDTPLACGKNSRA